MTNKSVCNTKNQSVLSVLKQCYKELTSVEQKVAFYILSNPEKTIYMSVKQMANAVQTSEASVVRMCKTTGYGGFGNLKVELARDIGSQNTLVERIKKKQYSSSREVLEGTLNNYANMFEGYLQTVDYSIFEEAVNKLKNAKRIGFFAVGDSFPVAYAAFWRFSNIGKMSFVQQDAGAQLLQARSLTQEDAMFVISSSGQSRTPINCAEIAKSNQVPVICITQNIRSELADKSNCVLLMQTEVPQNMFLSGSKVPQLALVDALSLAVLSADHSNALQVFEENIKFTRYGQY